MLRYEIYINDILSMIERIEKTNLKQLKEVDVWDSTLMRLQVIGESVKKIPKQIKNKHKEISWDYFAGLRNIISHTYTRVLPEMVEDIIKNEIPKLKETILKIK